MRPDLFARVYCFRLFLAAALCLLALPGGAQTLDRGLGPAPESLDIHLAQSLPAINVIRDLHEGLITFDAGARLIPGIAMSWETSTDGLRWTFELDPRARWSDGRPITANDFVRGWQRALDPDTASPTAALLDVIANAEAVRAGRQPPDALGVKALAPDRLMLELARPTPWLAELLTHPVAFPMSPDEGLYSGPFRLARQVPGAHLTLVANPAWRLAEELRLERVVWHVIEDPSVELARYRAGQLHITETIPPGRLAWLEQRFGDQLRIAPYLGTFFLAFNLSQEPFAGNRDLRRALSLVIDRELIARRVIGAGELPAWRLVPPGMPGWPDIEPPAEDRKADLAKARELYRRAGYGPRRPLRTELRFNTSLTHRRMAAAVAAMWKQQLGVETRLVNEEWAVFATNRRQGRITQIVRGGWIADWRDPANFLQLFESSSPLDYSFFRDPEFDRLMQAAANQTDQQRIETLWQAEQRLLDEQVIIPIYYYVSRHLVKPEVEGFEDNAMDIHLSRWLSIR